MYVRAGVTASEVMELVAARGGGGVRPSKLCISVLRSSCRSIADTRKRAAGVTDGGGSSVEAVQIAGPEGVFQERKASAALCLGGG